MAGESPGTEAVATCAARAIVLLTRLTVKFGFELVRFRNLELNERQGYSVAPKGQDSVPTWATPDCEVTFSINSYDSWLRLSSDEPPP